MKVSELLIRQIDGENITGMGVKNTVTSVIGDRINYTNYTMPEKMIITSVLTSSNTNYIYINAQSVLNGKITRVGAHIPLDFEMTELPKNDPLFDEIKIAMMKDLSNNLQHSVSVGTDPEIFVENEKGEIIPAFKFLGTKETPTKTRYHNKLYWDGFQAEFNTMATGCLQGQVNEVYKGLHGVLEAARKFDKTARLSIKTTVDISPEALNNATDEQVAFGCMPSMNVYGLKGLDLPGREVPFRSAGGHIHFGFHGKLKDETVVEIIKSLDAILGVASVSLFANMDDKRRRSMYGLPGEYRLPPHGIEYRTLSNAWLCHPIIMHLVFDLGRRALVFGKNGLLKFWDAPEHIVIDVIKNNDVDKARNILDWNKTTMLGIFNSIYHDNFLSESAFDIFRNGVESFILKPENIEANWRIVPDAGSTTMANGFRYLDVKSIKEKKLA